MKRVWSSWQEYLNATTNDITEESSEEKDLKPDISAMRLDVKDCLYGRYPEYDDFYLITCKICGKRVKPQSLYSHTELRHSKELNVHKSTIPAAALSLSPFQHTSLNLLPPNCSDESSNNQENSFYKDLIIFPLSLSKDKIDPLPLSQDKVDPLSLSQDKVDPLSLSNDKIDCLSNKKTDYIQQNSIQHSQNTYYVKENGKLNSFNSSSGMIPSSLANKYNIEKHHVALKSTSIEKVSSKSSSSNCDSQTSMTVFLHQSFIMPNIKLCDIKDGHNIQSLKNKTPPKRKCLSEATILTRVLPTKKSRQSIKSPRHGSQVHQVKESEWYTLQNSTKIELNKVSYSPWNRSSCFRALSHNIQMNENEQMDSFNIPDLSEFDEIEAQVLIQSAAMST